MKLGKMNEDVNGNRKLFLKEVSNAKVGKGESCSRIKDEARRIWEEYLEDTYIIDTPLVWF